MGKKDINVFTDKETARREDAILKRVLSTPPKHKTAKDDKANQPQERGRTTSLSRGEISRERKKTETRPDRENLSACLDSLSLSEVKFEHIDGVIRRELVVGECARQPE
jgi:hypothetical protein